MPVEIARRYGPLSIKVCLLQLAGNTEDSILGCLSQSSVAKNPEISITSFQIKKTKNQTPQTREHSRLFSQFQKYRSLQYFFLALCRIISLLTALKGKMWCLGDLASAYCLYRQLIGWITSKYFSSVPQFPSILTCK